MPNAIQSVAEARRRRILDYFIEHGGTATARKFGISRARVYQILEVVQYGRPKPRELKNRKHYTKPIPAGLG